MSLLLMFAPTVCLYLRLQGLGSNWVIAIPDVRDLPNFAFARRGVQLDPKFIDVASLGDAGMRFLTEFSTREPREEMRSGCRVIAMGGVKYYSSQSIRKSVLDVSDRLLSVKRYRILHGQFPNHFQFRKADASLTAENTPKKSSRRTKNANLAKEVPKGNGWFKLPTGRGRIADNLVQGRPWYRDP